MLDKKLGKIKSAAFGYGGYQDACIGVSWQLGGEIWGVGDFWGTWSLDPSEGAKWSDAERIIELGKVVMRLHKILQEAKKSDVAQLEGVPIEAEFEDMRLKSWRVLTEVI
jgi:hypothetical protein